METRKDQYSESMVLHTAWQRYAELDRAADRTGDQHKRLSVWVILLGVLTIAIAVFTDAYALALPFAGLVALRVALTLLPLAGVALLAFSSKFQFGERWQALRSGAEEIRREIYFYRTVLQGNKERDDWLGERLGAILRRVHEQVGGELVIKPFGGRIPPGHRAGDPESDSGFADLLANDYLRFRLHDQLHWHTRKLARFQQQRNRLQLGVYGFSVLASILAGLAWLVAGLPAWVAVASAAASALTSWIELRRMDSIIQTYGKVCLELGIVRDRWLALNGERRTGDQFFKLVASTERVLWSQHNRYFSEDSPAAEAAPARRDLLAAVLSQPVPEVLEKALKLENLAEGSPSGEPDLQEIAQPAKDQAQREAIKKEVKLEEARVELIREEGQSPQASDGGQERISARERRERRARPHAFVVMPFGRKPAPDGRWIDFNAVYQDLIRPALDLAGFEPFRADDATASGDILTDMFQELLLADLVIADMSIDNANVFYELGIRHAFRKRGIVHIQSGRAYMPFDVFNVRTIPYHLDPSGKPDPEELYKDIVAIARVCRDTYKSDQDAVHSPVFNLLTGLDEPERKHLRTPLATGFWREYNEWQARLEVAQRQKRIGDILLLTEEISNPLIREEAIGEAGKALRSLNQHALAIQQYKAGQALNPLNEDFRREEAFHLNRLGRRDEAIVKLEKILEENPRDVEAVSYLGRIYREMWSESWQDIADQQARLEAAFKSAHWLAKTVRTYLKGYRFDQDDTYPGINALTWSLILDDLARKFEDRRDPEVKAIRALLPTLRGAVQFALESQIDEETGDYWKLASLAELYVTSARDIQTVQRAYKKALTTSKKNAFYLQSSLGQLKVLESLCFRPEFVAAGRAILQEELDRIVGAGAPAEGPPAEAVTEELVFLFAGHMLDKPDTLPAVFPPGMEEEARARIAAALDEWVADSNDLAITVGAAAGGDILFLEECLKRGMKIEILLPYEEPLYIQKLIASMGDEWVTRYYDIRNCETLSIRMQTDFLGPLKPGQNVYERNNRWAMFSALVRGIDRVRFLALWDGRAEPNTYGAIIADMVEDVRGLGARVRHLDTTKFDFFQGARSRVFAAVDALAAAADSQPTRKRKEARAKIEAEAAAREEARAESEPGKPAQPKE
jgi:tetratricopeptide (TPR) repeat protein